MKGQSAVHEAIRVVAEVDAEVFAAGSALDRLLGELRALAEPRLGQVQTR
jgi:hypothetical protein